MNQIGTFPAKFKTEGLFLSWAWVGEQCRAAAKTQAESESPALACSYPYCENLGRLDWHFLTGQMERNRGATKGVKEIMTSYTHHKKGGAPRRADMLQKEEENMFNLTHKTKHKLELN